MSENISHLEALNQLLTTLFADKLISTTIALTELTVEILPEQLLPLAEFLRDDARTAFNCLIDVCGVDYLHYGLSEWETESATESGFSRGVMPKANYDDVSGNQSHPADESTKRHYPTNKPHRFAVVYHLLSLQHNHRIRLRVFLPDESQLIVDSLDTLWPSANWFEREAFDLFGILFRGHPDLRRILTDYGFVGHPFRKDFPLIGRVEARYDASLKRVVYEPVSIQARILEPKVIRRDNRYEP